jgi:hypothetical protein
MDKLLAAAEIVEALSRLSDFFVIRKKPAWKLYPGRLPQKAAKNPEQNRLRIIFF